MNAMTIADWFLAHNNAVMKYNSADELSNSKIQKLLYYAQGCSLASIGKALFEEEIIAWKHGPVVECVYQKYHQYGRSGITDIPEYPELEQEIELLLINIYNAFAKFSAWELANLTHTEDPWKYTKPNEKMSLTLIKNYFMVHYSDINKRNEMTDNVRYLYEISQYKENWDDEDGLPFDARFIREIIDLVSTMKTQPDIGPTGRGSIDFEYGSLRKGQKYLGLEIFEKDRSVHLFFKDKAGRTTEEIIGMEDVNGRIQQF